MIIAYIKGKVAYPDTSSSIKIKLENPFIKDGEEKSMEIVFPMQIPENRMAFGTLNRLDTSFVNEDIDNCALFVDNIEVVRGTGTITHVSESEVKVQILSGKKFLNYRASFDDMFIDQIDFGSVENRHRELLNGNRFSNKAHATINNEMELQGYVGEPGKYVFLPIHDESNDYWCNSIAYLYNDSIGGHSIQEGMVMVRAAVQPNLLFILRGVLKTLGYTMNECFFDKSPWNNIYVASARVSLKIGAALPHWTAYEFLEEIRKLFNAVFLFDETNKTVSIVEFNQSQNFGTQTIEPIDEFTASYDEEGLEYLGASNLEYELSSCERPVDVIPSEVRQAFDVIELPGVEAMYAAFDGMDEREKLTTLFHCPTGWFFGCSERDDEGSITAIHLQECGWLSPLIRRDNAASIQLRIVPVAINYGEIKLYYAGSHKMYGWDMFVAGEMTAKGLMAHTNCENQPTAEWFGSKSIKESEYITVEDVLVNNESVPSKDSSDKTIEVFFVGGIKKPCTIEDKTRIDDSMPIPEHLTSMDYAIAYTDYRYACYHAPVIQASMALNPQPKIECIGQYHNDGIQIKRNINGNNEICVKFLWKGKPDTKKIYIIRNKKYICSRIEMDVQNGKISELKTGYFYEMS